jgi:hypothetical protein
LINGSQSETLYTYFKINSSVIDYWVFQLKFYQIYVFHNILVPLKSIRLSNSHLSKLNDVTFYGKYSVSFLQYVPGLSLQEGKHFYF